LRHGGDALGGGKAFGVLLEPLSAEKFCANGFFDLRTNNRLRTDPAEQALK
jgi:hypothetical protein